MLKSRLCSLIFIIALAISLVSLLPAVALAQESVTGTIDGQLVNGTAGGGNVAGMEVSLIPYVNGVAGETSTTMADGEGRFRFDNVAIDNQYLVSTKHMGIYYYYSVTFETGTTAAYIEVNIFDATDSDEAIRVKQSHTIVNAEENDLLVTEVFMLVNDGDKTYAGTNEALVFTLPQGATGFQVPQEQAADFEFLDNNRVTYLVPFPPGERQVVYSFILPVSSYNGLTILLQVDYPTDALDLMVAGESIEVATTQLAPAAPVVTDTGEQFIHFRGNNLSRNTVIDLQLSKASQGGGALRVILYIIMAVVIAGIAVYLVKRMGKRKHA